MYVAIYVAAMDVAGSQQRLEEVLEEWAQETEMAQRTNTRFVTQFSAEENAKWARADKEALAVFAAMNNK